MVDVIQAILLGIVEGVTEFLPISSTGHLILVNQWISFTEPFTFLFDIVIQLGAILAAVVFFWKKLWPPDTIKKALLGVIPNRFACSSVNGIYIIGNFSFSMRYFIKFLVLSFELLSMIIICICSRG